VEGLTRRGMVKVRSTSNRAIVFAIGRSAKGGYDAFASAILSMCKVLRVLCGDLG